MIKKFSLKSDAECTPFIQ